MLANAAAKALVTGVDIWEINANETVFNLYSRYNYVGTNLYTDGTYSASDHNPEVIGIKKVVPASTDVQIIGTNDFHGRLLADGTNAAGAAVLSGAVKKPALGEPGHGLRRRGRPDRRLDLRVLHPEGRADDRRAQRGRPGGLGRRQPRVRPGLRGPRGPGAGPGELEVHRRQRQRAQRSRRSRGHLDQDDRRRQGRLRRRGHRGPADPGQPRWHPGRDRERHRRLDQRGRGATQDRRCAGSWSCWSTRARPTRTAARRSSPTRAPSGATSPRTSRPTWTRSSPATRTRPTTARSPSPSGPRTVVRSPSARSSRPASTAPTSTSLVFTVDGDGKVTAKTQQVLNLTNGTWPADPAVTSIVNAASAQANVLGAKEPRQDPGCLQPRQAGRRHHREPRW
ncbi:hypothetical protein G5V59_02130 [Nocardioides sp. W3-2-3]|uniref:hypothetical protein n=1 Tax=Nocardioides convexus TaxID=2712224 RepID=UPI0024188663|nr:hypothetical protein [Nocardioides convexus]NGZ99585.1 hypothetical protein [Nocardioides convexus]